MTSHRTRARQAYDDAYATYRGEGRWAVTECAHGVHVWADGGGAYSLSVNADGVPMASCVDGVAYGWTCEPVTLDPAVHADIVTGYAMCAHVAGIPAVDILPDMTGDEYVWIIDGRAYIAREV